MADVNPAADAPPRRRRGRPDSGARDKLLEAAMELFIERDYADVATEEIIGRAGVSRGAMYHHFAGKLELFEAVYEQGETDLIARLGAELAGAATPLDALRVGTRAYLSESETSPYLRRIGLRQARAVLGWDAWRRAAMRLGLGVVTAMVRVAMDAGELRPRDPELTAHLVLAALIEAALLVAAAPEPGPVRAHCEQLIDELIDGLAVGRPAR